MSTGTEKKPSIEAQADQTYIQVEAGIYRYKDKESRITYHERPFINGKRSYRSLGFMFTAQRNIKFAREEYSRRRTAVPKGEDPYAAPKPRRNRKTPPRRSQNPHLHHRRKRPWAM